MGSPVNYVTIVPSHFKLKVSPNLPYIFKSANGSSQVIYHEMIFPGRVWEAVMTSVDL